MVSNAIVLLSLSCLIGGISGWIHDSRQNQDQVSPAPLNHDGTVAFTKEVLNANAAHKAAFAQELQKIQASRGIGATHHRHTSPGYNQHLQGLYSSQHGGEGQYTPHQYRGEQYNSQTFDDGQYKPHHHHGAHYISEQQDNGQYRPSQQHGGQHVSKQHDDGQYKPHHHQGGQYFSKQQDDGQYKPYHHGGQYFSKHQDDGQYKPHHHGQAQYQKNTAAHIPATLNADGTVAHTPEYNAIASSFHAAYNQALTRHRRSAERYHGPPAPLNHDGTVAFTPEIQHANAAHKAAYSNHYQRLQEAAHLAASHPDLTSPPSQDYNQHDVGQYNFQHEESKAEFDDAGLNDSNLYDNADAQLGFLSEDDGEYKPHLYEAEGFNF